MSKGKGLFVTLGIDTGNFSKGIKGARTELSLFDKAGKGIKQSLGGLTPAFLGMAGVGVALGAAIGSAVTTMMDFEKANSKLKSVADATTKQMEEMTDQAIALGSATAFTASEVTDLQTEFAKLGFPVRDIINMTESTLNASAALGSELGEQAALTGAVLKSFAMDSTSASHVNDVLAQSAASSALGFEELSVALPIVSANAKASGVSFERTAAILGVLSDRGMGASMSATALRDIFIDLSTKGITWEQAMAKINGATDKNVAAFDLFGKTGATAALILADAGASLDGLEKSLLDSDGAAKKMAATMKDNLAGDVEEAKGAWESFILSVAKGDSVFSQTLRSMTKGFTNFLNAIRNKDIGDTLGLSRMSRLTDTGQALIILKNETAKMSAEFAEGGKTLGQFMGAISSLRDKQKQLQDQSAASSAERKKGNNDWKESKILIEQNTAKIQIYEDLIGKLTETAGAAAIAKKKLRIETEVAAAAAGKGSEDVVKMTAAEERAAVEARNLASGMSDVIVKYRELRDAGGENAMNRVKNQLSTLTAATEHSGEKPKALSIPITGSFTGIEEIEPTGAAGFNGKMVTLGTEAGAALSASLSSAANEGLAGFGESLGSGNLAGLGDSLIGAFAGFLSTFGKQLIALGVAQAALAVAIEMGPFGAAIAIGAGIALIAASSAIKNNMGGGVSAFAQGGLVTGATMGLVGEGRGTSMSNPEVIAPLDKLKGMIGGTEQMLQDVVFRIHGDTLVGILKRNNKVNAYSK